jgi:DMSO/TMAO reductase YedYZ molybdopterin-dependent catalytic subunit
MATNMTRSLPRTLAAVIGLLAGSAALGTWELLAGLVDGIASPIATFGALVIALQPPGAQSLVVSIFGTADKLALNLAVLLVALLGAAALGLLARRHSSLAEAGYGIAGTLAFAASLREPLNDWLPTLVAAALSIGAAIWVLRRLLRIAHAATAAPAAEMPDWSRRRFIGTSVAVGVSALTAGTLGRVLLEQRAAAVAEVPQVPGPVETAAPLPAGAALDVPGITPLVISNADFYRIDTQLFTPHLSAGDWKLTVTGMVDHPLTLTYDQLLAMPLHEEYVTIQCVSNEVGGDLVGNALWRGVRLNDVLDRAGVQAGATQLVGRAFDGWTGGFPTAWLAGSDREALIAVAMNGEPLPPAHGYPARLMVPGLYGYVSATKWLTNINLTTLEGFDGYWIPLGWAKLGPIKTASRIDVPRPDQNLVAGALPVAGVAWAPDRGISAVELQVDDGPWLPAELSTPISASTWVQWLVRWNATRGRHQLRVRATDGDGTVQIANVQPPAPSGATGYHTISVQVS